MTGHAQWQEKSPPASGSGTITSGRYQKLASETVTATADAVIEVKDMQHRESRILLSLEFLSQDERRKNHSAHIM